MKTILQYILLPILFLTNGCGNNNQNSAEIADLKKQLEDLKKQNLNLNEKEELKDEIKNINELLTTEIDGSCFIATRGGTSYKLSLVNVLVYDQNVIEKSVNEMVVAFKSKSHQINVLFTGLYMVTCEEAKEMLDEINTIKQKKYEYRYLNNELHRKLEYISGYINERSADLKPEVYQPEINNHIIANNTPVKFTKTDADGKFNFKLKQNKSYTVVAQAQRLVGEDTEKYYWATNISTTSNDDVIKLFLSNDNIMSGIPLYESKLNKAYKENEEIQKIEKFYRSASNIEKSEIYSGDAFLYENKRKKDVKTTVSGLQYKILKEGTGPSPTASDKVICHYTVKLIDGKVIDSSVERGQPATFPLNRVISGFSEGVQLMKVGGSARLFIPPDLAYGASGSTSGSTKIGPNKTLIYDTELIAIDN